MVGFNSRPQSGGVHGANDAGDNKAEGRVLFEGWNIFYAG